MAETPQAVTDETLARSVQEGSEAAFAELVDRYESRLMRYGRKFLSDTDPIKDVVQDVFIKVYENINSFDPARRFSPWIYRIAHNAFVNVLRKRSRDPVLLFDFDAVLGHHASEEDIEADRSRADMRAAIEAGIGSLSPTYREVIVLYYLEELSYTEIADVLQVPIGTVGIRLSRARSALQKHFTKKGVITHDDL